ncbi:hypothetical protein [Paenibacillus foliorum]|uniref:hypothetical protein n=1 Tax=Paenibacillus foliorum TaxID=2654974 RepID=UPI001C1220F5|nr:hypothetical protein [Paenibacillus foliorum]
MIICAKIHIPHVKHFVVARPRLLSKLDEGMKVKLTLVSSQAGYGKTTALSEWVKKCNTLVAWVSLDEQDNDWWRWRCNLLL